MSKQILFSADAKLALKRGIDIVADAVKITLGPRGRNVVFDKGYGAPTITNDGVSIAKEITLADKFENMGAEIIKEVASKTNDMAGDGTTTSVILTAAIITAGLKQTTMGANGMLVRRGIESAREEVVKALRQMAHPIKSDAEIRQVATISAESEELGNIIADTIKKVGKDGVVTVEESQSFTVESEVVEGLQFDKGYVSPYMITDTERMESVFKDALVLVTDKKISSVKEILPLLEKVAQTGKKELVIIAEDVDGEALTTFVLNKLRGGFNVLAVKAPGFSDKKKDMLEDIAIITGAKVISDDTGLKLDTIELNALGRANKIIATKDKTIIVGGKGKKADLQKRIESLKGQINTLDGKFSKYDREKLEERVAKLSGGVAVVRVGAATETEMKYLKLKIEDAVNATKAAIEEGIVPGGGVALVKAYDKVNRDHVASKQNYTSEFEVGFQIVLDALMAPLKQIAINAGKDDGSVIVEKVKNGKGNMGYDALLDVMIPDMLAAGIVDPVKVTRSGVEHATSAAAIFLTTDVAIADLPEKEKPQMPNPGMGMDY